MRRQSTVVNHGKFEDKSKSTPQDLETVDYPLATLLLSGGEITVRSALLRLVHCQSRWLLISLQPGLRL